MKATNQPDVKLGRHLPSHRPWFGNDGQDRCVYDPADPGFLARTALHRSTFIRDNSSPALLHFPREKLGSVITIDRLY